MPSYRINAWIDAADHEKLGMNAADFFSDPDILSKEYGSVHAANWFAKTRYKGPDIDGIGCLWEIEMVG